MRQILIAWTISAVSWATALAVDPHSPIEPVVMPMDFVEWARGAAAVAIQQVFP